MEGGFFGSIIFEAFGAFFRWIYVSILNKLRGRKSSSFKEVWEGKKTSSQGNIEYGFSNIILGIMIGMSIIIIIKLPDV
jgi:hypothetical protein